MEFVWVNLLIINPVIEFSSRSLAWHKLALTMQNFSETLATHKNQIFCFCLSLRIYSWYMHWGGFTTIYNGSERLCNDSQRFTTVHIGSHTTFFNWGCEPLRTVVNRCELIEIYSLAHVNRKKLNIPKQQKLFSTFCLNVSSKTISWNNSCQ